MSAVSTEVPPLRPDGDAASRLQILATEHWSLLATRSLTYNESLARVNIFLAVLSSAVIALALVAQADHFGSVFIAIAIPVLCVVLFAGVLTISRLMDLNREDYLWVIGMNRLRHGYLEIHPELARYFTAGANDDLAGALQTLGIDSVRSGRRLGSLVHIFNTLPGMLTMIVAAVAAAVAANVALAFSLPALWVGVIAAIGFLLGLVLLTRWHRRGFINRPPSLEPRFPTPTTPPP